MVLAMTQPLQPATSSKAKLRDPWLDNAKMVLVTIVVVGHMVVLVPGGDEQSRIYDFIYYFHIPAFVLVTGYLSKSFRYSRRHLWALLTTMVIPYVVFSWLMIHWRYALGEPGPLEWFQNPRWPMWYLAATVMWRLLTPLLRVHPVMVPVSVVVSLLAGLDNNELVRHQPDARVPAVLRDRPAPEARAARRAEAARRVGGRDRRRCCSCGGWPPAPTATGPPSSSTSGRRTPSSGAGDLEGIWIRARLIVVALVGSAAVLTLVPHRRSFLTRMGTWSLVVYLCHGFVVRYLEYRGFEDWMPGTSWWSVVITVAVAIALALVIAWEPIARTLNYVVDPVNSVGKWFRSRRSATADR